MYQCLLNLNQAGVYTSPWLNYVKAICNDCGLSQVWLSQEVVNPAWFRLTVEQQLKDQWITKWFSNLETKGICSNYKIFKHLFQMEDYLIKLDKSERITFCKFRAGNHKLPIITGRHTNIARENRICPKCNGNFIGDEFHLLFVCQNNDFFLLGFMC